MNSRQGKWDRERWTSDGGQGSGDIGQGAADMEPGMPHRGHTGIGSGHSGKRPVRSEHRAGERALNAVVHTSRGNAR